MTAAEVLQELLKKDGRPTRQLEQYEPFQMVFGDPIGAVVNPGFKRGSSFKNGWGVTIDYPEDAPGPMPHITEETKVLKDITHWRDYVKAPDISVCTEGWEFARGQAAAAREKGKLATVLMGTGIFEQCHFLMGFEDTLTALYEHPQEMHELIEYIFAFRMQYLKLLVEYLQPDAILSHDDWGTNDQLFMQPDLWREFFKEPYRQFYGYMREHGVIAIHHADSFCAPIIEDMAEIGIQIWQGVLPENNIPELQKRLQGSMVLMGGIGAAIDRADSTEDAIYSYTMDALERYCPGGHYIPCATYGLPGTVFPHVSPVIDRAIEDYNAIVHFPSYRPAWVNRRKTAKPSAAAAVQETAAVTTSDTGVLEQTARALQKGQKKKVLSLCREALDAGIDPQKILSEGLVLGMTRLGDDFSANRAFVPEMLMAARCMTAATELLKPYLVSGGSKAVGRVCIGTVKGDMHDIGKNLVKIMMEGSGLEVIDLGTDVSAEHFVETAIAEACDIICCSALLTTTMGEMRRVVKLAEEKGIRDRIKIQIGGAPISQAYCDEIGADIYTEDAAAAARAAVAALA